MPYADRNRDRIDCLFNWNEKDRLLLLPGARYRRDDHGRDIVSLPLSWGSCLALRGMFGAELRLGQTLGEWAAEHRRSVVAPGMALRSMTEPVETENLTEYHDMLEMTRTGLKPFQAVGVKWMQTVGSGVLGDEMGSGKTVQSLSFLDRVDDALPALVIVPNSVKRHWKNLSATWAARAVPYVVDGTATARRKTLKAASADPDALVIINLESVRSFSRLAPYGSIRLRRCQECDRKHGDEIKASQCEVHEKELNQIPFRAVFLDEAHRIGNPDSKQTRAVWQVMNGPSVRYRWGLSGTVQSDHFGTLWPVLHAILPDDFPVKSRAVDRYCLTREMPIGPPQIIGLNPATREELFGILDPHFRRMVKAVTSPQLPPVLREVREVELPPKMMKVYNEVASSLFGDLGGGDLIITHSNLTKADRLQRLASSAVEVEKTDPDDVMTWKVRMKDPAPKIDALMEILEDGNYLTGPGPGVAVSAVHKDLIRLVSGRLTDLKVGHGIVTGDYTTAERDVALARFQNGDDRVLLFTVAAGSEGLDMTAADTLVNLQRPWSMIKAVQTEGRVHRIGSEVHDTVRIIDLLTVGTIEEEQVNRLAQKLARLEEINRDTANVPQNEQDPDLVAEAEALLNGDIMTIPSDPYGRTPLETIRTEWPDARTPEQVAEIERRKADPVGTALESLKDVKPYVPYDLEAHPDTASVHDPLLVQLADARLAKTADVPAERMECPDARTPVEVPAPSGIGSGETSARITSIDAPERMITIVEAPETPAPAIRPERMECPCCTKDTKINADGTIRYHFAAQPEYQLGPDSRRCKAVGEQWTWTPDTPKLSIDVRPSTPDVPETAMAAPLPAEQPLLGYVCRVPAGPTGCGSVVELTANGRARSHLDPQGKKCDGGSDHPIKVLKDGTRIDMKDQPEIEMCVRCGEPLPHEHEDTPLGARPVEEVDLPSAYARPGEPGFPETGLLIHSTPSATVGLVVTDGVVTDGPPYAQKWAVGETKGSIEDRSGDTTWIPDRPEIPHVHSFDYGNTDDDRTCKTCECGISEPRGRRLLITGSRTWGTDTDAQGNLTPAAIQEWEWLREKIEYAYREHPDTVLVSGACPKGADFLAEHVWTSLGGTVERHPADWDGKGKRAGFIRNMDMAWLGADLCMAFIKNGSRGASHMVDEAARAGIVCLVMKEDGTMYVLNDPEPVEAQEHAIDVRARQAEPSPAAVALEEDMTAEDHEWQTGPEDMARMPVETRAIAEARPYCQICTHSITPWVGHFNPDGTAGSVVWVCEPEVRGILNGDGHECRAHECQPDVQSTTAAAAKLTADAQVAALAEQNGTGHLYTDPTGVEWVHPGPREGCQAPDCLLPARAVPVVLHVPQVPYADASILGQDFLPTGAAAEALAAEGPLPDQVVSATKINDWQQCKRKWWLRWYRQLDADSDLTDVRNTGIRIHEALAAWYVPEGEEKLDPRDVLRQAIKRDWNETLRRKQIVTGSDQYSILAKKWESVAVLERAMVEGYMEWIEETGADAGFTVVGSELEVAVNMTDPATGMTVQARGVVDAKIRRDVDGVRLFIDHKSVGDFERATRFLKMRNQMLHYHLIEWLSAGPGETRCDGALYNMLRRVKRTEKAKPPFFQRKEVMHTELQLRAYRARLLGEARSMARAEKLLEAGVPHHMAVPPSPSDDCHWKCDFAAVCPMFDDGSRAEDMLQAVYHQGDPWQRYDLLGSDPTPDRSI